MSSKFNNAVGPQVRAKKKGPGKLVPLLAAMTMVGSMSAATQFFASSAGNHPSLGSSVAGFYPPWRIVSWALKWHAYYPEAFMRATGLGIGLSSAGLLALLVAKIIRGNTSEANQYLHGSARWAEQKDIEAAGLLGSDDGVYVGGWLDNAGVLHYLRHSGPEHILTYAPTRSGKGLGLVIPTLLTWKHSAFITDLKGELWAMTAGWRKAHAGNKVLRFEPAASNGGIRWNPLNEIRIGSEAEVGDAQNLATLLVDPDGKGDLDHWHQTAQALLVGVVLHALYKARDGGPAATLAAVDALLADPSRDVRELWMEMTTYSHWDGLPHPAIAAAGRDMLDRPDEEAGSVLSTTKSCLSLYRDPVVAMNTSESQFKIKDLMNAEVPVSLYIVTQPNDKDRLRPLVRVMVNMIIRLLADRMEFETATGGTNKASWWRKLLGLKGTSKRDYVRQKKGYKHRLLGMIDEFPSLGKLGILQEALAYVAGYGIKMYLICQDINQVKSEKTGYGHDETISSNCHIQNAYPPNRIETAKHLSELTGVTTIVKEQVTTSGKRAGMWLGQVSRTTQEVQRPLLTPDESMRMKGPLKNGDGEITEAGDMVVYVAGRPAIYGRQILYFQDDTFLARAAVPAPKQSDVMGSRPSAMEPTAISI
jgi:type IV secretion system protein VirD4